MIETFGDDASEDLYHGISTGRARRLPAAIVAIALRKLDLLNAAAQLSDLRVPPGNRLEELRGDLKGNHSIGVNERWRIVFRWGDGAYEVALTDDR